MTQFIPPDVECEQEHASLAAPDIPAAVEFYTKKLGFKLGFLWGTPPTMAGVNLGQVQMFLEEGAAYAKGASVYFTVDNADALFEFHRENGVLIVDEPGDREYGLRDYRVRDLNGYMLGFGQHIFSAGEPIYIERVDVPVRLERRLAALLIDLAEYKRMSIESCLEETLLHTLDGVGPHTKGQLRQIQKLKQKHAIDYDTHGSYRFKERG